jgi:FKBP-type peptidyl-prolyl cis-trans isomerase (trigger factor)
VAEKNFKIEKVEKLPNSEALILGEITIDFLNACRKDAIKHLNEHLNLPGFRKGNIPEDILIKTVGEMHVLEETAEIAISKVYGDIILESELKPITRPEIKITKMAPGIPLAFQINVSLEPEVTLPDYKKLAASIKPLEKDAKDEDKERRRIEIVEKIIKETKVNLPARFIESETAHMLHHFKQDLNKANIKWEEYLEKVKKTENEVNESFKEQISNRAKAELIISKIAEKENLKISGEVFDLLEKNI